jgi:hypothetical protein
VYTVPAGLITSQATVTVVVTNGGGCDATAELTVFVPEFVSAGQVSIDFADLVLCAGSLIATDISDTASATVAGLCRNSGNISMAEQSKCCCRLAKYSRSYK